MTPSTTASGLMPVGQLLKHSWEQLSDRLATFLPLSLVVLIFPAVISAMTFIWLSPITSSQPNTAELTALSNQFASGELNTVAVAFLLALVASIVVGVWGSLAMIHAAKDSSLSAAAALRVAVAHFWSYLLIALLIFLFVLGVMVGAGIVMAVLVKLFSLVGGQDATVIGGIIGGIALVAAAAYVVYQSIRWSLAYYILVTEGLTGRTALRRSAALMTGRWWAVVGRLLALALVIMVIQLLVTSILSAVAGDLGELVGSLLMNLVVAPFSVLFAYSLYQQLRTLQA